MAFSDLISKPITAPLEGLDKSIATGVELANNQYRTQIAMEQNQLEREKLQASYLDKANAMLPSLLKSKGKARSILMNQYINYSARGGSPVNADSMDVMLSQSTEDLDAAYQNILNSVGGDRQRAALVFRQKFGEDAPDAATFIEKSAIQGQASQLAMGRAVYQQGEIEKRQLEASRIKRQDAIQKDVSKKIDDTRREVSTLLTNIASVEAAIKQDSLALFNKTLGQQAKTSGTTGALSDYETKLRAPSGIPAYFAEKKMQITGESKIPDYVKKQVNQEIADKKEVAARLSASSHIGTIEDRMMDPQSREAYIVQQDNNGNLKIGFAAARMLESSNRALNSLGQAQGTIDLNSYLKKQTVPMTSGQILKFLKDASTGNLLDRKTKAPSGIKYIIKFSPESIIEAPTYQYGAGPESYSGSQQEDQLDSESGE